MKSFTDLLDDYTDARANLEWLPMLENGAQVKSTRRAYADAKEALNAFVEELRGGGGPAQ